MYFWAESRCSFVGLKWESRFSIKMAKTALAASQPWSDWVWHPCRISNVISFFIAIMGCCQKKLVLSQCALGFVQISDWTQGRICNCVWFAIQEGDQKQTLCKRTFYLLASRNCVVYIDDITFWVFPYWYWRQLGVSPRVLLEKMPR